MSIALSVKNLTKKIKDHTILDNINLEVEEGEICGIVGRNASGKSMLFKAITGLVTIDKGKVEIFGEEMGDKRNSPQKIGALIEYPGFLPQYSGRKNLEMLAYINKIIGRKEIEEAMRKLGLDPGDKRSYRKYSLGMRQKLGIAAAIMESPSLILLDEPTNNIDQESIEELYKVLFEINEKYGTTILVSSHHMEDIKNLCSKVYKIDKGILEPTDLLGKEEVAL